MLTNISLNEKIRYKLAHNGATIDELLKQIEEDSIELALELYQAQGLEIVKKDNLYFYATTFLPIDEAVFCVVDIETNGSNTDKHQIIEIGAKKIQGGKIIDSFESLVHCDAINENITKVTGISSKDTINAPLQKEVMKSFKAFLQDSIVVAHDAKFDFKFISSMMKRSGFEEILNRHLCSIDLAERTIVAYRYGLGYLNDLLCLNKEATHHRALSDATTTAELFIKALSVLDESIITIEQLIEFSKKAKRLKRPTFDPLRQDKLT